MTLLTPERNRILSNFARMFTSLLVGIFLVRELLSVGPKAYGLYAFAVTGFGVAIIIREVLRVSFVAFLSQSLSQSSAISNSYRIAVKTMMSVAFLLGLIAVTIMAGVAIILPFLGFDGKHVRLAQAFFGLRALSAFLMIIVYPLFLSTLVQQKQVTQNIFLTVERLIELVAIILAVYFFKTGIEYQTLTIFALVSMAFSSLFYLSIFLSSNIGKQISILPAFPKQETLKFHWPELSAGLKDILGPLLYFRFDLVFLTAVFGPIAALILGLGVQFSGYVRQVNQVLIAGLDARFAAASFSKSKAQIEKKENLRQIFRSISHLQGLVIFFLIGFLILFLPELLSMWLGDRLENSGTSLKELRYLIYVLLPGIAANTMAQSWIIMQTGAGKLRGFVNFILGTAILNPILLTLFILISKANTSGAIFVAASIYSTLNCLCFMGIIPVIVAKQLGETPRVLLQPLLGPLLAGLVTVTIALIGSRLIWNENRIATFIIFMIGFIVSFGYFSIFMARKLSNNTPHT